MGAGVAAPALRPTTTSPASDPRLALTRPFVFYAGRREWGKGWQDLLRAFEDCGGRWRCGAGPGDVRGGGDHACAGRRSGTGSSTWVSSADSDRNGAMAAAAAYVQPSANESFSRTVLEAWLGGHLWSWRTPTAPSSGGMWNAAAPA